MNAPLSPSISHDLIGHEEAVRQVGAAFASGRMHHAWLLAGIDGIGKTSFAWHIANHVLSNGANAIGKYNPHNRVTKLIQAEAHPDLLVVRRAVDDKTGELKSVISVEAAREIAPFLHKTASHGGWRVVIIDEAHMMNRQSENAILKIVEEPPAHALILITATTPGALLPTIRSRCRVLHLSPLDDAHMKVVLSRSAPNLSLDEIDRLIALSGGSAGFALKIARTEALPLCAEMEFLLNALPALDIPRLHKLADQISRKADAESFDVVRTLLLERVRRAAVDGAKSGAGRMVVEPRLRVLDKITALFDTAEHGNLDRKLAFIRAMTDMREAVV